MNIQTHQKIDYDLCGKPVQLDDGYAKIKLKTTATMIVDDRSLVHGGFVFGLADHAAMLAVNHPNVVLAAASVKFLKPVQPDTLLIAEARVVSIDGKKQQVDVKVMRDQEAVFDGQFVCFTLKEHVLGQTS
ncbi:MAG: PaaI family thioesterase [Candidatus Magnetomorum sp.]|nr:PaaI family thioesterase [Candidatus Magnetomorum sp.]